MCYRLEQVLLSCSSSISESGGRPPRGWVSGRRDDGVVRIRRFVCGLLDRRRPGNARTAPSAAPRPVCLQRGPALVDGVVKTQVYEGWMWFMNLPGKPASSCLLKKTRAPAPACFTAAFPEDSPARSSGFAVSPEAMTVRVLELQCFQSWKTTCIPGVEGTC